MIELTKERKMENVQVAVRIRPMLKCELKKGFRPCLETIPGVPQVKIFQNTFTFSHVFDHKVPQIDVYDAAVKNLVQKLFGGYNVTVLAYGQTGSGKTHSMGTNYPGNSDKGIIPRAVDDIFQKVESEEEWEFKITASFIELYNDQLYDLLSGKPKDKSIVELREDSRGVVIPGLTEVEVTTTDATVRCLQQGSSGRATGATAMNAQSSRSHAIFTIHITQTKKGCETESMNAKFHLVDLAGSERVKKTKAIGDRFREGVNINTELFILGNVISALGDGSHTFINYRDSKLTRLLQDSLGGNAFTIMIACVSPVDNDHSETINTLKYADRARRIKNKPIVNKDPKAAIIARLKKENEELKLQLLELSATKVNSSSPPELAMVNQKIKMLTDALNYTITQVAAMSERALMAEKARDCMKQKLVELNCEYSLIYLLEKMDSEQTTLKESQLSNLKKLETHIVDLEAVQKKNEEDIIIHEISVNPITSEGSPREDDKFAVAESPEDLEHQINYLIQQTKLIKKLQEHTMNLAWKELVVRNKVLTSRMSAKLSPTKTNLMDIKQQIKDLEKEKEELTGQLKNVFSFTNAASNECISELEQKITAVNKKITEQARVLAIKENSYDTIKTLHSEIRSMKETKMFFINEIKFESEKYRTWKREEELCKLKQDRQWQKPLENIDMQQQCKFEEAATVNKRLKDALALQKDFQESHIFQGYPESVSQWVIHELQVMVNTLDAERAVDQLIVDRATLNKNLQALKVKVNNSQLKKEERTNLEAEIKSLTKNLDLKSTQIMHLKQKIEDSDQENKAKTRWEIVRSDMDAKFALRCLFEAVADAKKESNSQKVMLQELNEIHNEQLRKLKMKEQEAIELQKAMLKLEQEYEVKIFLLLRHLQEKENGNSSAKSDEDILRIQEDELSKMNMLRRSVDYWMQKYKELEKTISGQKILTSIENRPMGTKAQKILPSVIEIVSSEKNDQNSVPPTAANFPSNNEENSPGETYSSLHKRLQFLKQLPKEQCMFSQPAKRANNGILKCMCDDDCSTRFFICRMGNVKCSTDCKCDEKAVCLNRMKIEAIAANNPEVSEETNRSLKKLRLNAASNSELTDGSGPSSSCAGLL